jgi:hypothetical protein
MKKIAFVLLFTCIVFSSCKNDSIKYKGPDVINIVLQEQYNIDADSKEPIVYSSDNNLIVDIIGDGTILGKNVGEANVTLSNTSDEITIPVIVSLFEEPSVNFGVSPSYIKDIYGDPNYQFGDSIYIYGGGGSLEDWYSYAVWKMDFFFKDNAYSECDLYINSDLKIRIDQFLNDNYHYYRTITDTISSNGNEEVVITDLFLNSANQEEASVLVGKQEDAGPYDDICLFYIPYEHKRNSNYNDIFSRDRR